MANLLNTLINSIKHWYVPLILGILFLVFGIYIFTVPLETYVTLSILFSISFITSGLFEIFFSIQNSKTQNSKPLKKIVISPKIAKHVIAFQK